MKSDTFREQENDNIQFLPCQAGTWAIADEKKNQFSWLRNNRSKRGSCLWGLGVSRGTTVQSASPNCCKMPAVILASDFCCKTAMRLHKIN